MFKISETLKLKELQTLFELNVNVKCDMKDQKKALSMKGIDEEESFENLSELV